MKTPILKRITYFILSIAMTSFLVACGSEDDVGTTPLDDAYYMCDSCMQGMDYVLMSGVGKDYTYQNVGLEIMLQVQGRPGAYTDILGYPQGGQVVAQGYIYTTGANSHYAMNCGLQPGRFHSLTTIQPGENTITSGDGQVLWNLVLAIDGNPNHTITMNVTFERRNTQDARGQRHAFRLTNHALISAAGSQFCNPDDIILQ